MQRLIFLKTVRQKKLASQLPSRPISAIWRVHFSLNLFTLTFQRTVWPHGKIVSSRFGHLRQGKFAQNNTNYPKVGSQLCQIPNKPLNIAKYFLIFAKVTKFRQIWSHCFINSLLVTIFWLFHSRMKSFVAFLAISQKWLKYFPNCGKPLLRASTYPGRCKSRIG